MSSSQGLFQVSITPKCKISIVIPVRNEAKTLAWSLAPFTRQKNLQSSDQFELLILANNCTDNSVKIIQEFQKANPSIQVQLEQIQISRKNANIGFVRRLLMNEAFNRLQQFHPNDGVIMTTDGDTVVADDWISANLMEIENGADAVGGRIIISEDELQKMDGFCREIHTKDELYRLLGAEIEATIDSLPFDQAPRHHQHFNGSFAVTTKAYRKSGGVPKVRFLEDCAFFAALERIDAKVRHSPHVKVYTSARHLGRSEVGLSFQLNEWKKLGKGGMPFMVEPANAIIERFSLRRELRKLRGQVIIGKILTAQDIIPIAKRLFVEPGYLLERLQSQTTFGALYESIMRNQHLNGEWAKKFPPIELDKALADLQGEIRKYTAQSFSQVSNR